MRNRLLLAYLGYFFLLPFGYAAEFSGSVAYQVTGTMQEATADQAILSIRLDAISNSSGSWGVSGIQFKQQNTNNLIVKAAKLYLCNSPVFSNGNLLDSIVTPNDTLNFSFNLSGLGINSRYLFLVYDLDSNWLCNTLIFDAEVVANSLVITGLGAGNYTPTDPNPTGSRLLPNPTVIPSLFILPDSAITCESDTVTFRAYAQNQGSHPIYKWYKNGSLKETNSTGVFLINDLDTGDQVFCKLLSSLSCVTASTVSSPIHFVNFSLFNQTASIQANGMETLGNLIEFKGSSNYGGSSPNYQWYKNSMPVGQDDAYFQDSTIVNGDRVYFTVNSNSNCVTNSMASSTELTVSFSDSVQKRTVALLDLGPENQETNGSNLYSAGHMLDVAGISYKIVTDIYEAQNYRMVVGSSTVGNGVFSNFEHIALRNYVRNGGILLFVRMKDPDLNSLFGISSFDSKTSRHLLNWETSSGDPCLGWFEDSMEYSISLGDTATNSVIETLGYTVGSASALGKYDDGKAGFTKNHYGSGYAYNFGISLKEIIFRNQVNKDYDAEREYTNAFEPSTDELFLLTRAIYTSHISFGVWKHTSPGNSVSTLITTHDIDALSSVNLMNAFSNYEDSNSMGSTYFMTVHYNNDVISAFYDSSIFDLNNLLLRNRVIASHSVGHFVDMDDSLIIQTGQPGNTRMNYTPVNNGGTTVGATIWGELEVSKNSLENDCNTQVKSFRPGYLLVHPKQMKIMDSLGYKFSSSYTAPDVLTNFPYFIHEDKSFQSRLMGMLEIPIATSDVTRDFVLDSINYPNLVNQWLKVYRSNHRNNAPTVLLIHPTRNFKLAAQRSFVNQLPTGVLAKSLEDFGSYWNKRNQLAFSSSLSGTILTITLANSSFPLDSAQSLIVDKGQLLSQIIVQNEAGAAIGFIQENWPNQAKLLYLKPQQLIGIKEQLYSKQRNEDENVLRVFPNPSATETSIRYELAKSSFVTIDLIALDGKEIKQLYNGFSFPGESVKSFAIHSLEAGSYLIRLTTNQGVSIAKLVVLPK